MNTQLLQFYVQDTQVAAMVVCVRTRARACMHEIYQLI